jgi:bacillopeptidase F
MAGRISRLQRLESKRNRRSAVLLLIATVGFVYFVLRYAFVILPKFTDFLRDLSGQGASLTSADVVPPSPPRFDELPPFTNEKRFVLTGDSELGSSVLVKINDSEKEVIVNASGEFTSTLELKEGKNIFSAVAIDRSGNKSAVSDEVIITYDTEPPKLEIEKPVNGESFYGSLGQNQFIEGNTEMDASVLINDRVVVIARDGKFKQSISLQEGENTLIIVATDMAGNETKQELKLNYSR